ncbi:TetR/AcrR family transcriptional regulator [Clostridium sp. AM58-1XD]|uniref:TetR/AcrR family transcriptional regulator n=1 Tax=Clostridium sp. AM58-1XD TaxID=2292307 RepID=UPI000E4E6563|nr:TetR/AcrR family transcriptional regulator [Clostridium sp. AM58-1XD]RGZ01780.1 TetR/AcrR family transcriptional regulator [Clostridium sp. AM58-1XD]
MKREEKNLLSRQKILESAMKEFGERGYGLSSINTICSAGGISKGILYHYFKDKDEVYLACVKECFDSLTAMLNEKRFSDESIHKNLQNYFETRFCFFEKNPLYQKVFCDAVVMPPAHLFGEISRIKEEFDRRNVSILTEQLSKVKLRGGMTVEEAVDVFRLYQDYASARYRMDENGQTEPETYEEICRKSIYVMLYGVAEKEGAQL